MIKTTKCKCGKDYIEFDNQIGQCPDCAPDKVAASVRQEILRQFTYLTTDAAFKLVLGMLVTEVIAKREMKVQRLSCEESHATVAKRPEAVKRGFFARLLRRK